MKTSQLSILKICLAATLLGGSLAIPSVHAHGIWFAQRSGDIALIYGEGGDDLDATKRLPLIQEMTAFDAAGKKVPSALNAQGKLAVADISAAPAVLAAVLDNGLWSKTADGHWHKKPKTELTDVVRSSHNLKYAVHLLAPLSQPFPVLPAHTLQLIPLTPVPETRGETLLLRVLFQGQPLPNAKLIADFVNDPDAEPLTSNAEGIVELPVRNQGLNVIAAEFDAPPLDARQTDAIEHTATLSFRLKHAPE